MSIAVTKPRGKVIEDSASHKKPSLRISHIVYGREGDGRRVRYLLDENGEGTRREIAENIVLVRWRQRTMRGYSFSGGRLGPNIWNAFAVAFGRRPTRLWMELTVDQIQQVLEDKRARMGVFKSSVPAANVIFGLIQITGWQRLEKIMARHLDPNRGTARGTPDLFLFATDKSGRPSMGRFVEVKKPEEPASEDQKEEVDFLNELGLHARIIRLIER